MAAASRWDRDIWSFIALNCAEELWSKQARSGWPKPFWLRKEPYLPFQAACGLLCNGECRNGSRILGILKGCRNPHHTYEQGQFSNQDNQSPSCLFASHSALSFISLSGAFALILSATSTPYLQCCGWLLCKIEQGMLVAWEPCPWITISCRTWFQSSCLFLEISYWLTGLEQIDRPIFKIVYHLPAWGPSSDHPLNMPEWTLPTSHIPLLPFLPVYLLLRTNSPRIVKRIYLASFFWYGSLETEPWLPRAKGDVVLYARLLDINREKT